MIAGRIVLISSITATGISFFTIGLIETRRSEASVRASYDAELNAIRSEVRTELGERIRQEAVTPAATVGRTTDKDRDTDAPGVRSAAREKMVAEIKQELQREMGLMPLQLLRDRRSSFVELYSYDN